MKIKTIICFLLCSPLVFSQEPYKLGAVDPVRVLDQSPQREQSKSLIEKEFSPRDRQLVAEQKKLRELEDKLQKNNSIMSKEELSKLERQIITRKRELKRDQEEFREDLNFRRNEEFAKIQKQIVKAIQKVAIERKYDVVLSEGVIYASSRIDISDLVIEYLKKEYEGKVEKKSSTKKK